MAQFLKPQISHLKRKRGVGWGVHTDNPPSKEPRGITNCLSRNRALTVSFLLLFHGPFSLTFNIKVASKYYVCLGVHVLYALFIFKIFS